MNQFLSCNKALAASEIINDNKIDDNKINDDHADTNPALATFNINNNKIDEDNDKINDNVTIKYDNNDGSNNNFDNADNQLDHEVEVDILLSSTDGELILTKETALTFLLVCFDDKYNQGGEIVL